MGTATIVGVIIGALGLLLRRRAATKSITAGDATGGGQTQAAGDRAVQIQARDVHIHPPPPVSPVAQRADMAPILAEAQDHRRRTEFEARRLGVTEQQIQDANARGTAAALAACASDSLHNPSAPVKPAIWLCLELAAAVGDAGLRKWCKDEIEGYEPDGQPTDRNPGDFSELSYRFIEPASVRLEPDLEPEGTLPPVRFFLPNSVGRMEEMIRELAVSGETRPHICALDALGPYGREVRRIAPHTVEVWFGVGADQLRRVLDGVRMQAIEFVGRHRA